jgi:murein tripeptide amidase MpaA
MMMVFLAAFPGTAASIDKLRFDHNYTNSEVVAYLEEVTRSFPNITKLHHVGKSYLGKDLFILEITNQEIGDALEKPGYWLSANIHAGEVFGPAICLKTIETMVTQYGKDPLITNLVDTRTAYIMPKINPDGSDYYLTKPDGMSHGRPYDSDRDGLLDEDPPEDLNKDRNITLMRVRDELGEWKTSPEDPRLMVRRKEDEKGQWRVYSEGIDNDEDGRFNEDGAGGLNINRNLPAMWQAEWYQRGSGLYPLSEPETRAVVDFLFSHRNVAGFQDLHMSGNFLYIPPTNLRINPVTGLEDPLPPEDLALYETFGAKYSEMLNNQTIRVAYNPPRGLRFGVMIDWGLDQFGVISYTPEVGSYQAFCDYDKDGTATEVERLRWNDTEMGGKVFVDWQPYDHPQLGEVEIGGFIRKIWSPTHETYINLLCYPGPVYEDFLEKHTKWNFYLMSMSPLVRITDVDVASEESGYFKIVTSIQNQGFLPTNATQLAIRHKIAKTVKATISTNGATLVLGKETVDLGHLPGNTPRSSSPIKTAEWMVKATGPGTPTVIIKAVSEKGGTDTRKVILAEK